MAATTPTTATLAAEGPKWGIYWVNYTDTASPCACCRRPVKRLCYLEHRDTGKRIEVGKDCYRKLRDGRITHPAEGTA